MPRPRCGNDPRAQLTDGDRRAVETFKAYLADRAALRDRIAEALIRWTYRGQDPDPETGILDSVRANAYSRADAVLAVLPPSVDQAAVLREAADKYATLMDQNEAYELAEHGSIDHESRIQYEAVRDVVTGLRRMANEAQPAEQPTVDALARMLSAADVEINHGDYPTYDTLAESGQKQYRQAARYLLQRLHITTKPGAEAQP